MFDDCLRSTSLGESTPARASLEGSVTCESYISSAYLPRVTRLRWLWLLRRAEKRTALCRSSTHRVWLCFAILGCTFFENFMPLRWRYDVVRLTFPFGAVCTSEGTGTIAGLMAVALRVLAWVCAMLDESSSAWPLL
ncbi:hypothetical protein BV20DRAFT_731063 [Pilatotrama ljubarskyi]|nr:hypothetical protein BV20DRAFT_731063 [Pilatotrama ljubarskyi]